MWLEMTLGPFSCRQESDAKKIIEFKAVQNKRIEMHEMQYRITCAQLSVMSHEDLRDGCKGSQSKRERTFISSAVCSPI